MACLDTTSKSLTIELTGSPTTQTQWTVHYATRSGVDFTESSNDGVTNSTTPVTMIASPGSGETISIRDITVYNADVSSVTIVIKLVNGGNSRVIYRQTLDTLESWSSLAQKGKDGAQGLTGSVSAASGLILDESSAPNTATNQGALYVPSSDNLLRYRGESNGTERRIALIDTTNLATNDLFYYGSDGLFKRIAIGTLDQVLIAQPSSNPPYQWATPTGREALTANRTYYVRTNGNDSNNGLADTAGGAFLTWTKAIDTIAKLDGNGYSATIKGTGTFSENIVIDKSFVGLSRIALEGDTTTPSNCSISVSSGFSVRVNTMTNIDIKGLLLSGGTGGIVVAKGDLTIAGNCTFGASNFQIYLQGQKAQVTQASNYTVAGGGTYHITCVGESYFEAYGPYTVTISGSPTFTTFAFFDRGGSGSFENITYSGSITGTKYNVKALSFVYSNGTTFPGSGQAVHALGYYGI